MRTTARWLGLAALLAGMAPAQGPDWYGDWMMWWSTNREEFLCRTDPAAASRPSEAEAIKLVTNDACRARIVPVLTKALKDPERQIREAAAIALGMCGDERDVDAIAPLLGDRDRGVVDGAMLGLGMLRAAEAEAALAKIVSDPATPERKRGIAALAIGLSKGDGSKKALLTKLGSDKSEKFEGCRMIAAGLWSGGDLAGSKLEPPTIVSSEVLKGLKGQEKRRKLLAFGAAALAKARDPGSKAEVLAMMADTRFDIRAAAAIAAGRVIQRGDQDGTRALIRALESEAHTLPTRFMIISLGRVAGPEAVAALAKESASGDKTRRAFAALALGIAGATDHAPRLRQELLGATEDRLRGALAVALGLLEDREAFAPIVKICEGRSHDELLSYCAWFFALSRNLEGAKVLEKILAGSKVAETQEAAAIALGAIGAVGSQKFLADLLQNKGTDSSRKAAAVGLGRMRDERGVDALLKAARADESVVVRAAAIAALGAVARRENLQPIARIAIDAYYGIMNEAIDDTATRVGSLMKTTEEGGGQQK